MIAFKIILVLGLAAISWAIPPMPAMIPSCVNGETSVHPSDCSSFYVCNNGKLSMLKCPESFHWNQQEKKCDTPLKSQCNEIKSKASPCNPSNTPPSCPEHKPSSYSIPLPHESDCSKFYQCDWGVRYLKSCPSGLHFSNFNKVCDWPWRANCECKDQTNP